MEDVILIWLLFHSVQVPISLTNLLKKFVKQKFILLLIKFLVGGKLHFKFFLHSKCKFQEASFLYNTEQILLACLYYIGYFLFKSRACLSLRKLKSLHLSTDINISLTLYTR